MGRTGPTDAHRVLADYLARVRREAGLKQGELAARLGKDQPWVSNIETCLRRVDVVEFIAIANAMQRDPIRMFAEVDALLPAKLSI
jgi:transcriptional regulator with XRE-family HTH domain